MTTGPGAPLSGDLLRDLDERLCRLDLGEQGLPGALYQGDPPYGTASVSPDGPDGRTVPYQRAGGEDESVLGMGAALRDGRLTPLGLLDRTLERIARSDGEIRAWAHVDADAGIPAEPGWDGRPLHGIPVGVKDLIDVAGVPTGGGSHHLSGPGRERLPAADAGCVARLRAAGAVIVGKTTTHEYAFGGTTPPTRNPHDPARIPGGSSGGSAAAVAAGHVRVAFGSDTAGSVRIPSSYCGTVGLVPSPGRLPDDGVLPLSWSLDRVGLITASVEDLALSAYALGISPLIDLDGPATFEGVRIGVPIGALDEPIDPDVAEAVESAFATVRAMGGEIVEVEIPHGWAATAAGMTIILAECLDYHRERRRDGRDELFGADVRAMLDLGERVPAGAYVRAQRLRHVLRAEALAALSGVDVLAMPTMPCVAPRIEDANEGVLPVGGTRVSLAEAHLRYNVLANLAALPCATQPVGVDSAGLPIGLQWVAAPGDDERLITSMTSFSRHGR
ncbi:amidase [Nonomuraea cavernae]|uniref:amidase n=1 Tax=Nonomuraea cavernae TaxID=2045107 RepID=UPI0033CD24E2